ncbi:hypothetical protein QQ045_026774 [Rhodiola kirilowii]
MPAIIAKSISILSDAGLGMAMFSLGLLMALQQKMIACGNKVAAFSMGVRFLIGPAVMAAASIAVGLHSTLLHIAIVPAALPQGIVPYLSLRSTITSSNPQHWGHLWDAYSLADHASVLHFAGDMRRQ